MRMMYDVCGEKEDEWYDVGREQVQRLRRNALNFSVERDILM